jgi:hypothetical protein
MIKPSPSLNGPESVELEIVAHRGMTQDEITEMVRVIHAFLFTGLELEPGQLEAACDVLEAELEDGELFEALEDEDEDLIVAELEAHERLDALDIDPNGSLMERIELLAAELDSSRSVVELLVELMTGEKARAGFAEAELNNMRIRSLDDGDDMSYQASYGV